MDRRDFLKQCCAAGPILLATVRIGAVQDPPSPGPAEGTETYNAAEHYYGMAIDISKCIGCGRCADACKTENDVPREPAYFRTWIERYTIVEDGEPIVESPNGGLDGFPPIVNARERGVLRSFFVPKLCNHCDNPPCVQVCPVGATFVTPDGVVLVDQEYCVGCRYCIQACPYGARFLDPETHTAEKCTFCYHRIVRGLAPACVEVCPTGARMFGEIGQRNSPLTHFRRLSELQVLKPSLNTKPKVYYANLDGEVR
jgi:Fe-S-cluster-containing dehydrogenase component